MKYLPALAILSALLVPGCLTSSISGTAGEGGGGGTAGTGGEGAETCGGHPIASAVFKLSLDGAEVPSPTAALPYDATVEGKVLSSGPTAVTIDTCPPGATCTTLPAKLEMTAPNLPSVLVPPGALIRLRFRIAETFGAVLNSGVGSQVLIENLPDWMGSPNPISTTSRIWFGAFTTNGPGDSVLSDLPYTAGAFACGDCFGPSSGGVWTIAFPDMPQMGVPNGTQKTFDITGSLAAHYVFQALNGSRDCEGNGFGSYWLTGS